MNSQDLSGPRSLLSAKAPWSAQQQRVLDATLANIRDVADFPSEGILFKDITPLLADPVVFHDLIGLWKAAIDVDVDIIVGTEARGFIFGTALAYALGKGFVPARKAGKLPDVAHRLHYDLEYGSASIEMPRGCVAPGAKVMVLDDVLATGGTAKATGELVTAMGATVVGYSFLLEIDALGGRQLLPGPVLSLLHS